MKPATQEQKDKAEARRLKFRALAKSLSALPKAERDALAARLPGIVTVEGRALSTFNMCLIAAQCPGATIVGGFKQWKKAGRSVKKGEHGLSLWIPGGMRKRDDGSEHMGFVSGVVFDVAQTEEIAAAAPVATCAQVVAEHFDPSGALRAAGVLEVISVGAPA